SYFRMDNKLRLVMASPSLVDLLDYPLDELIGMSIYKFGVDVSERDHMLEILKVKGSVKSFPFTIKRGDEVEFPAELSAHFVFDSAGEIQGIEGVVRNISERLRSEESALRFTQIFEDSLNEIYMFDFTTLLFTDVNAAAQQNMGYTLEELMAKSPMDLNPAYSIELFNNLVEPLKRGEKQIEFFETVYYRKDGSSYDVETHIQLMENASETIFVAISLDISERKRTKIEKTELLARVQRLQKLETIGTLAGGIAHDFNNVLSPIMGYVELAMARVPASEPLYDDLTQVMNAAVRAADLVDQILLFGKQMEKARKPLFVHSIIYEALKLVRPAIPSTVDIRQKIETSCDQVLADGTQLHQVIVNLCTNAWQAMEQKGGLLEIELVQQEIDELQASKYPRLHTGQYVCLSVSDTGIGMSKETLQQIYEPFFTTKPVDKGTGMGLSVVYGIVQSHDGDIIVKSLPGIGTRFDVYLPVFENEIESQEVSSAEDEFIQGGTESILIVDDEKTITLMLHQMLSELGYRIHQYNSSLEALAAFQNEPEAFDLLISDLTMPQMSGIELLQEVHKLKPDFPTILMTGYAGASDQGLANGQSMLHKPLRQRTVAMAIRAQIDN
ncbi:MAG: PAS domain S-box protein, partial [Pseudomonadales bacterium]|nr:PAS domain S-box protein [Pseudomonadales bacterium]